MSTENESSTNYSASANGSTGASANSSTSQDRAEQTGRQRQVSRQQGQASGQTLDTEQQAWQSSGWQSWQSPQQRQQAQPQQAQQRQQYGQYVQGQYGQYGQYRQTGQTPRQQMAAQQQRQAQAYRGTSGSMPPVNGQASGGDQNARRNADYRKPTYRYPDGQYRGTPDEMYESAATSSGPTWRDTLKDYSTGIIVILIIVVLLVVIVASIACSSNNDSDTDTVVDDNTEVEAEDTDDTDVADDDTTSTSGYSLSTSLLDLISSGATLSTFSLSSTSAPTLSDSESSAITTAIAAIEEIADVGFVFYDVDTGLGISYNVDTAVYGAGSYKAPYALYICEDLIEGGIISLTDVSTDLAESLTDSGASTYITLRDTYDSVDYDAWATALGVTDALYTSESHYPWYSARSAAKLWTEMYLYFQTGTETAQWLEEEISEATTSFIRAAIGDTATVMSRSGAYAGTSSTYDSLCDAGIVTVDGHTYVLVVMSYMPDSDDNRELLQDLISAIYAARDELSSDEDTAATTEDEATEDETAEADETTEDETTE